MPKLGESITEGTIVSLNIKSGDLVEEDQILFEVTTAKVNAEVPSPVSGKVVEILYNEGDTVDVGNTVMVIDLEGENATAIETQKTTREPNISISDEKAQAAVNQKVDIITESEPALQPEKPAQETDRWYSPVVMQLAKQASISAEELDKIQGTGYLGRLSKKDLKNYIEQGVTKSNQTIQDKKLRPVEKPIENISKTTASTTATYKSDNVEIKDMDAVIIAVAHKEFLKLNKEDIKAFYNASNAKNVLADIKGLFNRNEFTDEKFVYWRL